MIDLQQDGLEQKKGVRARSRADAVFYAGEFSLRIPIMKLNRRIGYSFCEKRATPCCPLFVVEHIASTFQRENPE